MEPTYPITVELLGVDGNAFNIIAKVTSTMRKELPNIGYSREETQTIVKEFSDNCFKQKGYDQLLQFIMQTVEVE